MKKLVAILALCLTPLHAGAQGFLELGIGQSDVDIDFGSLGFPSSDTKDTSWNLSGGWMFNPMIGLEVGYRDLGEATATVTGPGGTGTATLEADGFQFGAVARIPVGGAGFSVVPRIGLFMWDASVRGVVNGALIAADDADGTDLYFGIGVDYAIRQFSIGAHFARFDLDDVDVNVIELRLGLRF
jgi:OOP family OmpA-OmpF porin